MKKLRGHFAASRDKYRRLLGYAANDRKGWARIVAASLASSLLVVLQPWPLKVVIDHVIGRQPVPAVLGWAVEILPGTASPRGLLGWSVCASLGIFALNAALDVILVRAWVRVGQQMVYELAADLFARLQRRSVLFHSRNSVGDSMSRITGDSWCVYKIVETLIYTPAYALVLMTGMVVLMAGMNFRMTLVALAVAPLMAGVSVLLGRPIRRAAKARREIDAGIQSHVQQVLSGILVVQAFGQEDRERQRFEESTRSALGAHQRVALVNGLYNLASGLTTTLGTAVVLWFGARRVLDGRLTLGDLLVFLAYLTSLQGQMKALAGVYSTLQEIGASVDRVWEVLGNEPEVGERPGAAAVGRARGHVRLEGVSFGYEPGRPVLRGLELELAPGEAVAVVGRSGAGKTTLAGLLPRLYDPWGGRVTLDGRDLRGLRLADLRRQVALVPQEPLLFPASVAANVAYGWPGAARAEVEAAARAAGAHDFVGRLPGGYDAAVGERGATLSGGERQRLAVARALVRDAPVLVLDEPTSALDAEAERALLEALRRLMRGRTTLLIAHRLSTARAAGRIAVLEGGRIAELGSHDELLAQGGLYAHLFHAQAGHRSRPVCLTE